MKTILAFSSVFILLSAFFIKPLLNTSTPAPTTYGELRPFVLRDQNAKPFTLEAFLGKITVVNFVFTTCPGICPLLTKQMSTLEQNTKELGETLQFVSISVDPETDIPLVLKDYVQKRDLDLRRWRFVTGPLFSIEEVVMEGFRTAMGKRREIASHNGKSLITVSHSENFVLVDAQARLRAFLPARTSKDLEAIRGAIYGLLN